jgi:acetyl-CoA carboxylase biotin carboxyl carrier protein
MDLKEIKAVIDLMTKNGLTEFELEKADFKIRVRRGGSGEVICAPPVVTAGPAIHLAPAALPSGGSGASSPALAGGDETSSSGGGARLQQIVSPMVGTFYSSPSPDSEPYIKVGSEVNEDTVVCIIEAMKVMNEIKAEMAGVISEILAVNGKPVEFGKPLFSVRPK